MRAFYKPEAGVKVKDLIDVLGPPATRIDAKMAVVGFHPAGAGQVHVAAFLYTHLAVDAAGIAHLEIFREVTDDSNWKPIGP